MEDKKDYEIFNGKTLSDLFKDIYTNTDKTNSQVNSLVNQLKSFINNIDTAVVVVPLIGEYLDVKVKNNEHLVKLADTVQRLLKGERGLDGSSDGLILTDEEKRQLLSEIPDYDEIRNKKETKLENLSEKVDAIKTEFENKDKPILEQGESDDAIQDRQE